MFIGYKISVSFVFKNNYIDEIEMFSDLLKHALNKRIALLEAIKNPPEGDKDRPFTWESLTPIVNDTDYINIINAIIIPTESTFFLTSTSKERNGELMIHVTHY